jgi:predicted NAD/FAD-dependent oxidoreductase
MTELAIIGAGVAGLAAARALRQRQPSLAVSIFEQDSRLGGRVATVQRGGFIFDHGAQLIKAPTPELMRLLADDLPSHGLHDIGLPVWTFDGAGTIAPGDPAQNADPKWIYRDGLGRLGQLLGAGLDVHTGVRVGALRRAGDGSWSLLDTAQRVVATASQVLFAAPTPQTAEILAASDLATVMKDALLAELARARFRRCISLALAYDRRIERPFYALVNTDRAHPIAWLALEHAKAPERCPPGHSLLMAQMAARWSLGEWDTPAEQLEQQIAPLVSALLAEDLGAPLWSDLARWPYALPDGGADFATLNGAGAGLFFAGDYTAGQGRVHLAIESGWRAAEAIARALE